MAKTELTSREAALKILNWSRKKLAEKLPEFLPAIYLLPEKEAPVPGGLWTDGGTLFYHPETVIQDYLVQKEAVAAQMLHIIVHGLLGHIPKRAGQDGALFDAAADLKACAFLNRLPVEIRWQWPRRAEEKLYRWDELTLEVCYLTPSNDKEAAAMVRAGQPFRSDCHDAWDPKKCAASGSGSGGAWADAAYQIAESMAAKGKHDQWGSLAGDLCEEYRFQGESGVSYRDFLCSFVCRREQQEVDPDTISPIWYRLGLSLTGDTPLIEPEELREDAPALELAVALDTSGSCSGEVMEGFLQELLAILRDAGGPKVEMTLIQCDTEIQSVQVIGREDSAEMLMGGYQVHGFGGTDFRPVFEYVTAQREGGDGRAFRGLLYLSDGCGNFPDEKPDYPVAFLFPRDEAGWDYGWFEIPEWVTQVRITKDDRLVVEDGGEY